MLFNWNRETIGWYTDADKYTGFFRNIAKTILPMLAGCETMCDMGCGLGLLDLELARHIGEITCVDISSEAISWLKRRIESLGITSIKAFTADCSEICGSWDAICMSFFSSMRAERFLPKCKKAILIVSGDRNPDLFPAKFRTQQKNTVEREEEHLRREGLPYRLTRASFEFGQPFRSMEDAYGYVRGYASGISEEELDAFLRERLEPIENRPFCLYLPRKKEVGVFEIGGALQ